MGGCADGVSRGMVEERKKERERKEKPLLQPVQAL